MERRGPRRLLPWSQPCEHVTLSSVTSVPSSRLAWIDWMRGLACVLMFQTHCYDAWLGGDARNTSFLKGSQLLGTLPAPLFRLQEFLIAWGWAPWSDLLRVDVLNIIGLSMILMALLCGITLTLCRKAGDSNKGPSGDSYQVMPSGIPQAQKGSGSSRCGPTLVAAAVVAASVIALLTPPLYSTWRPIWLPWPLESYIDGCHNLGVPQPWLFPIFPWSAFAFAGLAAGFILFNDLLFSRLFKDRARNHTTETLAFFAAVGAAAILVARQLDHSSFHLYATYDYWHTSPNFLMMRVGLLLVITFLSYVWCRWGLATRGFSPLIQLGQTSLLVYWVHIEFVYGRFSLLPKRSESIPTASRGLLEIFLFVLILSLARTRIDWKKKMTNWRKMTRRVQTA